MIESTQHLNWVALIPILELGSKYELLVAKFFIKKGEAKLDQTLHEVKSEALSVEGFKISHLVVPSFLLFLGEAAVPGGCLQGLVIVVELGGVCFNEGIFLTKHHYFEVFILSSLHLRV